MECPKKNKNILLESKGKQKSAFFYSITVFLITIQYIFDTLAFKNIIHRQ
jgi:hypothetical protein